MALARVSPTALERAKKFAVAAYIALVATPVSGAHNSLFVATGSEIAEASLAMGERYFAKVTAGKWIAIQAEYAGVGVGMRTGGRAYFEGAVGAATVSDYRHGWMDNLAPTLSASVGLRRTPWHLILAYRFIQGGAHFDMKPTAAGLFEVDANGHRVTYPRDRRSGESFALAGFSYNF